MIRLTFVLGMMATVFGPRLARAEHTVGNGGGYAEEQVLFALSSLERAIEICLETERYVCGLNAVEIAAAEVIKDQVPTLRSNPNYVAFGSEATDPGTFPPGQRIPFTTERRPGAPILVNRTLLYRPTGVGTDVPISLKEAFALVVRATAYQLTSLNTSEALRAGLEIGGIATTRSDTLELGRSNDLVRITDPRKRVRFLVMSFDGPDRGVQFSTVLLQDAEKMQDVTTALRAQIICEDGGTATAFAMARAEVQRMERLLAGLRIEVRSEVRYVCESDPNRLRGGVMTLELRFDELLVRQPIDQDDRAYRFLPASLRVRMTEASAR